MRFAFVVLLLLPAVASADIRQDARDALDQARTAKFSCSEARVLAYPYKYLDLGMWAQGEIARNEGNVTRRQSIDLWNRSQYGACIDKAEEAVMAYELGIVSYFSLIQTPLPLSGA